MRSANYSLDYLTSLPAKRRDDIRVFTGHFPFVATQLLEMDLTTITLLRDPVERTLSYLQHCQHYHERHRGLRLEEIYEDHLFFQLFIKDHQAKMFALTADDQPRSYMHQLDVDADRLALAKANLERVDAVGTQDRFDQLLIELNRRFGWPIVAVDDKHVSPARDATASFRRRIAEDNAADMEFFEHARQLCERRQCTGAFA
jgi:hypothetical protein